MVVSNRSCSSQLFVAGCYVLYCCHVTVMLCKKTNISRWVTDYRDMSFGK